MLGNSGSYHRQAQNKQAGCSTQGNSRARSCCQILRPAPFRSPIEIEIKSKYDEKGEEKEVFSHIKPTPNYADQLMAVGKAKPDRYQVFTFGDQASLITSFDNARKAIGL